MTNLLKTVLAAAILSMLATQNTNAQTPNDAIWMGGTGSWNDALNWSSTVPPMNDATNSYDVDIDDGSNTNSVVSLNVNAIIDSLSIGAGDTLNFEWGRSLDIINSIFTNDGNINISAINGPTQLRLNDQTVINGNGTITMDHGAHSHLMTTDVGDSFTIGANQTVNGTGQIGLNQSKVHNEGTIEATTGVITFNPFGDATDKVFNSGIMRANGGTLRLFDGGLFNAAGTIEAANNSIVELNDFVVQDGVLNSTGTGMIRIQNGDTAGLDGFVDNNAAIHIGGINGQTTLTMGDRTIVNGTGSITLESQSLSNLRGENAGDEFTIGANQTIRGTGNVGGGSTRITNNGTIDANVANNRLIVSTGTETLLSNGLLKASNGGILELGPGLIDADSFVHVVELQAENNSFVDFAGSTIDGAVLNSTGTGLFRVNNGQTGSLTGSTTNNSDIQVGGINGVTSLLVNRSFEGTGTISLTSQSFSVLGASNANAEFANDAQHTVRGTGQVGMGQLDIYNFGLIEANLAGQRLTVVGSTLNGVDNDGTMRAINGGILRLGGIYFNRGGSITAADNSRVELGDAIVSEGTFESNGTGIVEVSNGDTATISTGITNNANLLVGGVNGTTRLNTIGNTNFNGNGSVRLTSQTFSVMGFAVPGDSLLNDNSHTIAGEGTLGDNEGSILNAGTIRADRPGSLRLNPLGFINVGIVDVNGGVLNIDNNYVQSGGVTVLAGNQTINASTILDLRSGFLVGDGTINGDVRSNSIIRPGYQAGGGTFSTNEVAGVLNITNLDLDNSAITDIEIGGLVAGTEFDFINIANNLELAGALQLSLIDGFESNISSLDIFTVMNSSSLTGSFANVSNGGFLADQDGIGVFQVHYGASSLFSPNSVVINNFSAVPEPSHCLLALCGTLIGTIRRKRRCKHQTNSDPSR